MNQVGFEGSAKSTPFAPLRAVDRTGAMRNRLNDRLRWMREDQQMVNQDRQSYAQSLQVKNRFQQEARMQDLESLSGMSKTLTDTLLKVRETKNEMAREEGLALFYEAGLPLEQAEAFEREEAKLIEARDKTNEIAGKLAVEGQPPEIVERVRNLSGWKKYGYMQGLAQDAGINWGQYLAERLAGDTETQIQVGDRVFTPAEASDQAEISAASQVLRRQYLRERGLTDANPALLNKYTFPNMKQGEASVIANRYKEIVRQRSIEAMEEQAGVFTTALQAGFSAGDAFNAFITSTESVLDPESLTPLGKGGARDQALATILNLAKDGAIDESVIDQIMGSSIPGGSQTWGDKFPQKFVGLKDAIRQGKEQDFAAAERQEAREDEVVVEGIIKLAEEKGGLTEAEKESIRSQFAAKGKPLPDAVANLMTVEQRNDEQAREILRGLMASGRGFTMKDLMSGEYSNDIILEFKGKANEYELSVTNNEYFKAAEKALADQLHNNLTYNLTPGVRPHWTLALAQAEAKAMLASETLRLVQGGMGPQEAAEQAQRVVTKFINDGKDGTGRFAVQLQSDRKTPLPNGGFSKYMQGPSASAQQARARFERIEKALNADHLTVHKEVLISDDDFKQLDVLRTNPNFGFPPSVLYIASRSPNLSPWDVADAQLAAAGKPILEKPQQVAWTEGMDPRLQQLLHNFNTGNRTSRAFTSMPWSPEKVPNGWGVNVEQAAKKYGIDPALLAGLLDHESDGWKPRAVSDAGAVGLAQAMPATAAEFGLKDRNDPVASIDFAAKYLNYLRKYFKGSINMALHAYNGGMGTIEKYGGPNPNSRENQEYMGKVLKAAAKYGYNPSGRSPFRNESTMNPRLVYKIGNLGYGSTGPHLDVKPVLPGTTQSSRNIKPYNQGDLDDFVQVKVNGKMLPLSKGAPTSITSSGRPSNDAAHRARGSFGHDYAAPDGTEVFLTGGAKVVGSFKGDGGTDHLIIELPDGRRYQFIHGKKV